jgi:double-stranded uracil-DNA glycosylase
MNNKCFDVVVGIQPRILILGSMPGKKSLLDKQYYAHPRNAFWPIMAQLFDINLEHTYQERLQALTNEGIALWDVLKSCERVGSLDADIVEKSIQVNDFVTLLHQHPSIKLILFNGSKAQQSFKRYAQKAVQQAFLDVHLLGLPSTSPAHASMSFATKCQQWQLAIKG